MSRSRLVVLAAVLVVGWAGMFLTYAVATDGPAKPEPVPFCTGSDPGTCNPIDPAIVAPIPPDAPIAVRLRAQLARERRVSRLRIRHLEQRIAELEAGR